MFWYEFGVLVDEVNTGILEAADDGGKVLLSPGSDCREEEQDVVAAEAFVQPVDRVEIHETSSDGLGENDALG